MRLSGNVLKGGEMRSGARLEPVGCSLSARHPRLGSTFQGERGFPSRQGEPWDAGPKWAALPLC